MSGDRYRVYSKYLKDKYGCKVYKLPVNLPGTCPNRDGVLGAGGCIYCGEEGAGFESLSALVPVREQVERNMEYISNRYNARKFIAYFQNFSNTYMSPGKLKKYIREACIPGVVGINISTRPDCISNRHLEAVKEVELEKEVDIVFEMGLQTVNYHSLIKVNRGHTLAEFIDGVLQTRAAGFEVCAHLIPDLPWDDRLDVVESAKILSALKVEQVKLHSLYVVRGTVMEDMYLKGKLKLLTMEEYVERVILFLEYLDPSIVLQRLIGRAPEENTVTANWDTSWWKIKEKIEEEMEIRDTRQGKKFDYLGGKAVKNFLSDGYHR